MRDLKAIAEKYKDPAKLQEALDCIVEDIIDGRIVLGEERNQMEVESDRDRQMFEYLQHHSLAQTARYFCLAKETVRKFAIKNHLR